MMRPTKLWRVRAKPDAKARRLSDTSRDYNLRAIDQRIFLAVLGAQPIEAPDKTYRSRRRRSLGKLL
ncbi:MAG: hypothetical protein RL334_1355 [Chloroflexota bacterium]|jgi:hypothetical protein